MGQRLPIIGKVQRRRCYVRRPRLWQLKLIDYVRSGVTVGRENRYRRSSIRIRVVRMRVPQTARPTDRRRLKLRRAAFHTIACGREACRVVTGRRQRRTVVKQHPVRPVGIRTCTSLLSSAHRNPVGAPKSAWLKL